MPTNRKRISRQAKSRIPTNVSERYFEELDARDFLAECSGNYDNALSDEEAELLTEYRACDCDLEKWKKMKKRA